MSGGIKNTNEVGKEALTQISRFKQYSFLAASALAALFTGNHMFQKANQHTHHTANQHTHHTANQHTHHIAVTHRSDDKSSSPIVLVDSAPALGDNVNVSHQPSFPSTTIPETVYRYNQYVADTTKKPTTNVVGLEGICDGLVCPDSSVVPQVISQDNTGLNTVVQPDTTSLRPIL